MDINAHTSYAHIPYIYSTPGVGDATHTRGTNQKKGTGRYEEPVPIPLTLTQSSGQTSCSQDRIRTYIYRTYAPNDNRYAC